MTSREGKLTVEGDRAALLFERRLPYPVDAVWAAITDPAQRDQWMGTTTIDAREGGTIEMVPHSPPIPPQQKTMTGRIRVWDPPRVFEHEWNQPILTDTGSGVVRYELTPDGEGTLLRFSHHGLTVRDAEDSIRARMRIWTGWRPTSAANPCPTGLSATRKSLTF